jgi:small-conductance mechanosensitive channel
MTTELLDSLRDLFDLHLFRLGGAVLTPGTLIGALVALFALLVVSRWVQHKLLMRLLAHGHLDTGTRATISSLAHTVVLVIGIIVILDGVGIKLSSLAVLAGALGVGVGFGLQNIFSNFISGLIVMFERPVKIGDHIVVSGVEGDVVEIGMRATTLLTTQNSLVIVPNQSFITGNVVNWDRGGNSATVMQLRMMGKVEEDTDLLLGVLRAHRDVLQTPPPEVFVIGLDHAGHVMEMHFWLAGDARQRLKVTSDISRQVLAELLRRGQNIAPNP